MHKQTSNLKKKRRENAIHPVNGYENHEDNNEEEEVSLMSHGKDRSPPVVMVDARRKDPLRREGLAKLRSVELPEKRPEDPL